MGGEHTLNCFCTKFLGNHLACSIGIFGSNAARYPHNPKTLRLEPPITLHVSLDSVDMAMNVAIDFNDQPALQADEINDKRTYRMLTAKP
jgi:hypothetical protein